MFSKSGLSKKDLIDKFKISIFEKNVNNTTVYAAELICSGYCKLLLNTCIDLWCKFYILSADISFLIYEIIELLQTIKPNEVYKYVNVRFLFIKLSLTLCTNNKQHIHLFQTKIHKKDIELNDKLNELPNFYSKIINNYKQYIDEDNYNNIIILMYNFYKKKITNFNKILSYLVENTVKKIDLKADFQVIHSSLTKNYIWIFLDILKYIYMTIKDSKKIQYYKIYNTIFNYDLTKSDILKRINIIFMLFNILINDDLSILYTNQKENTCNIDIDNINNIFSQLITFYELDTVIKETKESKMKKIDITSQDKKNNKDNKDSKNETKNTPIIKENVEYLYTLTYVNSKKKKEKENIRFDYFPAQKTINVDNFEHHNGIKLEIDKIKI